MFHLIGYREPFRGDRRKNEYNRPIPVFSQLERIPLQVCVSYPMVCVSRSAREREPTKEKLERDAAKGESWRDKATDGKLRGKEPPSSLIKQNNCWAQLASIASNAQCSVERNYTIKPFRSRVGERVVHGAFERNYQDAI